MNVQLVRDERLGRVGMIPFFQTNNIAACNVEHCHYEPTCAIIIDGSVTAGICECHYQEAHHAGKWSFTLDMTK